MTDNGDTAAIETAWTADEDPTSVVVEAVATGTTALAGCARLADEPTRLAVIERASDAETVLYDLGVDDTYCQSVDL